MTSYLRRSDAASKPVRDGRVSLGRAVGGRVEDILRRRVAVGRVVAVDLRDQTRLDARGRRTLPVNLASGFSDETPAFPSGAMLMYAMRGLDADAGQHHSKDRSSRRRGAPRGDRQREGRRSGVHDAAQRMGAAIVQDRLGERHLFAHRRAMRGRGPRARTATHRVCYARCAVHVGRTSRIGESERARHGGCSSAESG